MVRSRCPLARRATAIGVVIASVAGASAAAAQSPKAVEQARDAFDQGTAAYSRGEFAKAADYFGRADEIIPSDEALEAAIDSASRADDPVLAMRLVDRSARIVSPPKGLADAKRVALERFRKKAGRVLVKCTTECSPSLDGRSITAGVPTWTLVGRHAIVAVRGEARDSVSVDVAPEGLAEITLEPRDDSRARTPEGPPPPRDGLSPTWVWIGAGATAVLGGAAVVSGLDTLGRSDEFKDAGCEARGSDSCDRIASDGRSAQLRTNLFIGGAALTGIATAVLAVFFVDWRSRSTQTTALPIGIGLGTVAYTRTFP